MTRSAPRTYGIDLLRGVACFSVLAFHYFARGPLAGWMPDYPVPALEPVMRYGFLGVHLFFMVSGFVIFMSALGRTPREFVASRISRLFPALWVAATITMLVTQWHGNPALMVSWRDFAWNLTLIPQYVGATYVDGAYWSLAVELQFYLFVWLVLVTKLTEHIEPLLWAWLLLALADAVRPMAPVERWLIANWAPLFVIGAATFLGSSRGWTRGRMGLLVAGAVLSFAHAWREASRMTAEWGDRAPSPMIVCAVVALAIVVFVMLASGRIRIGETRWATIPGLLTYPVYLIHQFAGFAVYTAMVRAGVPSVPAVLAIITGSVAVGWAINRYVEAPLGPRLRTLVSARRPAVEPSSV